jgi:hypothetical protein
VCDLVGLSRQYIQYSVEICGVVKDRASFFQVAYGSSNYEFRGKNTLAEGHSRMM